MAYGISNRKQIYDLTAEDLTRHPVWEFALDEEGVEGQDEATVRPAEFTGNFDPSSGTYVIRSLFTLPERRPMVGHVTISSMTSLDASSVHPTLITPKGQIGFWCGVLVPKRDELAKFYDWLECSREDVFPISFRTDLPMTISEVSGQIDGFMVLNDWRNRTFALHR